MNGTKIAQRWRAERNRKAAQQRQARCECDISCFQNFIFSIPRDRTAVRLFSYTGLRSRGWTWRVIWLRAGPAGAARTRRSSAFSVFYWLEVADFDFFFGLLCFVLHFSFPSSVHLLWLLLIGNSLLPFTDVLRKIFGLLTPKVGFAALKG
jgi:hypothetical protein